VYVFVIMPGACILQCAGVVSLESLVLQPHNCSAVVQSQACMVATLVRLALLHRLVGLRQVLLLQQPAMHVVMHSRLVSATHIQEIVRLLACALCCAAQRPAKRLFSASAAICCTSWNLTSAWQCKGTRTSCKPASAAVLLLWGHCFEDSPGSYRGLCIIIIIIPSSHSINAIDPAWVVHLVLLLNPIALQLMASYAANMWGCGVVQSLSMI
jgi:hypothetical protein